MSKAKQGLKRLGGVVGANILYVWNRPIIISGLLVVVAILLFNVIVSQTFRPYASCQGLIVDRLKEDDFVGRNLGTGFCNAVGNGAMNPWLEGARKIIAWSVIVFFAFLSLFLTIFINRFITIVKFLTFNREEWRHFMATTRIWLLLFVVFGSIFYFSVIR